MAGDGFFDKQKGTPEGEQAVRVEIFNIIVVVRFSPNFVLASRRRRKYLLSSPLLTS